MSSALFADLYELTMAAAYHAEGLVGTATFDLFIRRLPPQRRFLVACGLADALDWLEELRFDDTDLEYLASLRLFADDFLGLLRELRFTGDVKAVPEGEVVFAEEPILTVTAPMIEAQIVETFLLNCISYQTMVASKAARIAIACGDRAFVDFSPRRDHGSDAALKTARASFVGGAAGTSLVLAGQRYGLPVSGTMAHSYVMAHDTEADAFRAFARAFPEAAVLLIDTYDTVRGARRAAEVASELEHEGVTIRAVRLDSGDLATLAGSVRAVLDEAGHESISVFASGDLDEYRIAELVAAGAPIDGFGVGTQLGTSGDAPWLGAVYKLVENEHGAKLKLAAEKTTLPGRKQVHRVEVGAAGAHDVIALEDEPVPGGRPLLAPAMRAGRRVSDAEPLSVLRARCGEAVGSLPEALRRLEPGAAAHYPVVRSAGLEALSRRLAGKVGS